MQNSENMEKDLNSLTKEDYNNEPVFFCSHCLSLKIINLNENISFCDECGNTEIKSTHINEWEDLYKLKYKKPFIK